MTFSMRGLTGVRSCDEQPSLRNERPTSICLSLCNSWKADKNSEKSFSSSARAAQLFPHHFPQAEKVSPFGLILGSEARRGHSLAFQISQPNLGDQEHSGRHSRSTSYGTSQIQEQPGATGWMEEEVSQRKEQRAWATEGMKGH